MAVGGHRVSERGQMALPAATRRRWSMSDGGAVEVADPGEVLVIVPADRGGLRSVVRAAIDDAGGYPTPVDLVAAEEPEFA